MVFRDVDRARVDRSRQVPGPGADLAAYVEQLHRLPGTERFAHLLQLGGCDCRAGG